jgi:hypothetical protein
MISLAFMGSIIVAAIYLLTVVNRFPRDFRKPWFTDGRAAARARADDEDPKPSPSTLAIDRSAPFHFRRFAFDHLELVHAALLRAHEHHACRRGARLIRCDDDERSIGGCARSARSSVDLFGASPSSARIPTKERLPSPSTMERLRIDVISDDTRFGPLAWRARAALSGPRRPFAPSSR